jgi:hypothetical protein
VGDFDLVVDLRFGDHGMSMRRKGEIIGKLEREIVEQ